MRGEKDEGDMEDMTRMSKCLSLMCGLILLFLSLSGCVQRDVGPVAGSVSGRVVLSEEATGLTGVSLLILDGPTSYVETNAEGYFETAAFSETVIIPRKTGYRFVPEKWVVGEEHTVEYVAHPWPEPDFSKWGTQFLFASHRDRVETLAFTVDDQYIASGGNDRTVRIWRTSDGQQVRAMTGHRSAVKVIVLSPDGRYLASGAVDGEIKIWDWQTGQEVKSLSGHTDVLTDLVWSPDGTKLASSGWDRHVRIWDFATGNELLSLPHERWVRVLAWSSDTRFVLSGGDDLSLKVWQVDQGQLSVEFEMKAPIMTLSTAPNGSLAAIGLKSGEVKVLNFETGKDIVLERFQGEVTAVKWSFDGRYLAAGTDRTIKVWNMETNELVQRIRTENYFFALSWGRESYLLVSAGARGIIDVWSALSGDNMLRIAGHTGAVKALAWAPQGNYLASGGEDRLIRIWDLEARKEWTQLLPGHSGQIEVLAWSPDGTYVASGAHDFLIRLWNINEGEYLGSFTERIKKPFVHARGFEFAVGLESVSHEDIVLALSWAPNGKRLASASWDRTVAIWDVPGGTQLVGISNPQGWITTAAWSPHGDQISFGGYDQAVHIYSVTGEEIKKLEGHTNWVQAVAYSPDGRYVASSGYDRKVFIWDLATNEIIRSLPADEYVVTVVEWSPCGRYLAGGSHNGTVRIWDADTGDVLFMYPGREVGLQTVAWSPQGDRLAITEHNSVIILGELD